MSFALSRRLVSASARRLSARSASAAASPATSAEALERAYLVPTYTPNGVRTAPGMVFTRGSGSKLYDAEGREWVDWAAGIAVNALGHSDAGMARVIAAQAATIQHVSNLFHTMEPLLLAQALVESTAHFDKVFFCNSGTEANEAALKFARKVSLIAAQQKAAAASTGAATAYAPFQQFGCKAKPPTACATQGGMCHCWPQATDAKMKEALRTEVVAFKHSFHGRSMGSLSATHKPQIRQPFAPFPYDVKFAPFNDLAATEKLVSERTAAIIVEPVQGEGGIFPATQSFFTGIRKLADASGALMIVDEVQCGLGRTGRLWAHEAYDVKPDMMTLAKPLAGGLPIGALLVSDAVASAIQPGDHGTTFGGNPFVAAVALSVFERIKAPAFLAESRVRGKQLRDAMLSLQAKYPQFIKEVRTPIDTGLFVGVELTCPPKSVVQAAAARGLIIITAGDNVLRICPPLNISADDIDFGVKVLDACFAELPALDAAATA